MNTEPAPVRVVLPYRSAEDLLPIPESERCDVLWRGLVAERLKPR